MSEAHEFVSHARPGAQARVAARYGTMKDASYRYGVSLRTIWRRAAAREIVVVRLGDKPLVDFTATDEMLHNS